MKSPSGDANLWVFLSKEWSKGWPCKKGNEGKNCVDSFVGKPHEYVVRARILWHEYANTAWKLRIVSADRKTARSSRTFLFGIGDTNKIVSPVRKYTGTYCPPFASSLGQPAISTAPPGTFAHSLGRLAFQTLAVGWTNQADRLPWRPYGLIRANIISEDARKNRRISENSFGQRSLSFFSFLLPSFSPSSFLKPSLTVRWLVLSQEKSEKA